MSIFGSPNIEKLKEKRNIKKLFKIYTSGKGDIKKKAGKALVEIGASVIEPLFKLIKESLGEEGTAAISVFVAIGKEAVEPLINILKEGKYPTRHLAVEALCGIGDSRAAEVILNAINDNDMFVSARAIQYAGKLVGHKAQDPIIRSLKEGGTMSQWRRKFAVKALGELPTPQNFCVKSQ